jgi:hypothetical protein
MGWDKDQIEENRKARFLEQVQHAKEEGLIEKVKETGSIDIVDEAMGLKESLKDILLKDFNVKVDSAADSGGGDDAGGDEFESEDLDMGDDSDMDMSAEE